MGNITEELGKNLAQSVIEGLTGSLFKNLVNKIELERTKDAGKKKALEGNQSEEISEKLKLIVSEYSKEIENFDAYYYTDAELRELFERYYNEYFCRGQNIPNDEENKEELYKRYKIFAVEYMKKIAADISFGERRILDKTEQVLNKQKKILAEIGAAASSSEYLKKISKEQSELLNKLCEDVDLPFIEFSSTKNPEINFFDSKYAFIGNVFDFDKSYMERQKTYVLSMVIKNIGRTPINEVEISNFSITFCKEEDEDDSEKAYYVLTAMLDDGEEKCTLNLAPNSEQKIHIITKRREEEISEESIVEIFMKGDEVSYKPPYKYHRLLVIFDVLVTGKVKKNSYKVYMYMSKTVGEDMNDEDMNGEYTVDYICMSLNK